MKQVLILLVLANLSFACKKAQNEDPTIFEGKVVYADDESPAAGLNLAISYNLKSPPLTGTNSGDSRKIQIGENGQFRFEFPYNEEYIDFLFSAWLSNNGNITASFTQGDGLDCSPYDCGNFKPHQNYSNLLIKIKRP
jgi:hypothetical protein